MLAEKSSTSLPININKKYPLVTLTFPLQGKHQNRCLPNHYDGSLKSSQWFTKIITMLL
jgi:hypothetical protein